MALLQNVVAKGTHAARPAAGSAGVLYFETDTNILFRDNGTSWDAVAWSSAPPAIRCTNSASISLPSATLTTLTYDTNRFDQGTATAQHSTSSNTSRLVCQVAGIYQITAEVWFSNNSSGSREVRLTLNGTTMIARNLSQADANGDRIMSVTTLYPLAVSDYVETLVYQNSGSTLTINAASAYSPEFMWARAG